MKNPQAKAILERIHQTLGNIICTCELHKEKEDLKNVGFWGDILASTMFIVRVTFHTTLKASPTHIVFGRDAMLNVPFQVDWDKINANK